MKFFQSFLLTQRILNIIYHLYDDRGLDLISNNKASLEKLYIKYNSWILDYDRDRINNLFRVI
ncbi:DUF3885 domain-containing protein [Alkaliphilus crotonatoxidans]